MQTLIVEIGREDNDKTGMITCTVTDKGSGRSESVWLGCLDMAAETVRDFIKKNFEDDGADVVYKVG
jgi:hypothetical protein